MKRMISIAILLAAVKAQCILVRFDHANLGPFTNLTFGAVTIQPYVGPLFTNIPQYVAAVKGYGAGLDNGYASPGETENYQPYPAGLDTISYVSLNQGVIITAPGKINSVTVQFNARVYTHDQYNTVISPKILDSLIYCNGNVTEWIGSATKTFKIPCDGTNNILLLADPLPTMFIDNWNYWRNPTYDQAFWWGFTVVSVDYTPAK